MKAAASSSMERAEFVVSLTVIDSSIDVSTKGSVGASTVIVLALGVLTGLLMALFLDEADVCGLFEPRVTSPSIDLFSFIVYNYSI